MSDLIADISDVVGSQGILTGAAVSQRPTSWADNSPTRAKAIVRPAGTSEVAAVMKLCSDAGQTVVPAGGRTGLVEGALCANDDIQISFERMTTIEEVDVAGAAMVAQAGVPLQAAKDAAKDAGLMLAMDFGARGSANIGGCISTNSGGNGVIRYGMMRDQVLGLEAVLADGTVISSMNRMLKNNAGYDLKQLFIGTEGTLGLVTRAVLRLRPELRSRNTALVAVDEYGKVPQLLTFLGGALSDSLTAFEVLWADFYETVLRISGHSPPLESGYAFYVLLEARGAAQDSDARLFQDVLAEALDASLIVDATIATSAQQSDALWAMRDDIDALADAHRPLMVFDISLPISVADEYASNVHAQMRSRWGDDYRAVTFGHLGDGNLHFLLTIGSDDHDEQQQAMQIIYGALQPYGGSISAEHGIGLEKRDFLQYSRSPAEIALMKRLKSALDPQNLLNPGKIFE